MYRPRSNYEYRLEYSFRVVEVLHISFIMYNGEILKQVQEWIPGALHILEAYFADN